MAYRNHIGPSDADEALESTPDRASSPQGGSTVPAAAVSLPVEDLDTTLDELHPAYRRAAAG